MSIPPSGGQPPAINYGDMVTGNDSDFQTTIGGWVNSGGTFTRDTTLKAFSTLAASAKLVTTTSGQYMQLPLTNKRFVAGVPYEALVVFMLEETPASTVSYDLRFGIVSPGTDYKSLQGTFSAASARFTGGKWAAVAARWVPATTTGTASIRFARVGVETGTQTWHIGYCRVVRLGSLGETRFTAFPKPRTASTDLDDTIFASSSSFGWGLVANDADVGAGFYLAGGWTAYATGGTGGMGTSMGTTFADARSSIWAEHTPGDLSPDGLNIEVGTDYVGIQISEKDSNTLQIAADDTDGYMIQLRNQNAKGWAISDDGTINAHIASYFQWEFDVTGALTTGTNLATHFQTPQKAIIDEVRIHVGTAPTGASLIVDVNDDGTTVFTTQGNRPEIAISGTDDTSGAADGGTAVAKNSVISIDIDQVGSTIAGSDLKVFVRGRYIW